MYTLIRRGVRDTAADLGLHFFLHMSVGPFTHDAGHLFFVYSSEIWSHVRMILKLFINTHLETDIMIQVAIVTEGGEKNVCQIFKTLILIFFFKTFHHFDPNPCIENDVMTYIQHMR